MPLEGLAVEPRGALRAGGPSGRSEAGGGGHHQGTVEGVRASARACCWFVRAVARPMVRQLRWPPLGPRGFRAGAGGAAPLSLGVPQMEP